MHERHKRILGTLHPERFEDLPVNWLHQVVDPTANPLRFATRVTQLTDEPDKDGIPYGPGFLGRITKQWWRHRVYHRTDKGDRYVGEFNPMRSNQHDAHQVMQDIVQASIQIGCDKAGLEMIHWPELLKNGWSDSGKQTYIPGAIFEEAPGRKDCHYILVHYVCMECRSTWQNPDHATERKCPKCKSRKTKPHYSRGDGSPFIIKHGNNKLFVLTKEIDRGTEHLTGLSRNTIIKKLQNYREIFERRIYRAHYDFPNSMVFIITPTESRRDAMLEVAPEVFRDRCSYIVYYVSPDWYNARSYDPGVMGLTYDFMTEQAGKRLGYPDFKIIDFK